MLITALLAASTVVHAQSWPDVTEGLTTSREGRADAAVLVAVSDYVFIADVPGAVDNANDWRRFLAARGVPLSSIHLLANGDATREAILDEAAWAADRVGRGGTVWFVYIGHGAPAPDGRDGLLVGADAQGSARSLEARSARRGEVLSALAGGEQSETVVVLDACFSGKAGVSEMIAEGLQPVIPTALATVTAATVLSAGKSDQFAGPLPGLGRPAFSYLTLGALRGWGDADGDGRVTATEAVEYSSGALSALVTDRRQEPEVTGHNVQVVLGSGREAGPDLLGIAESLVDRGPVTGVVDVGSWSSEVDVRGLEGRIRERECQSVADAEAVRLRDASIRSEGESLVSALVYRWSALRATSERCAEVDDAGLRGECRDAVATFMSEVSGQATVRMTAGEVEVQTDCGTRRGFASEAEVFVAEALRDEVGAFLDAYTAEGTRGSSAVGSSVSTTAERPPVAQGSDVTSPILGTLKWIPAGTFTMGSPTSESGRRGHERQHQVTHRLGFWMMERELTQGMWSAVMEKDRSHFSDCGDDCPVEKVSWRQAVEFAQLVSSREGVTYRLPTEAEWEYAARGGESTVYAGSNDATSVGWIDENSGWSTHPGCQKPRNGYGLCDMTGNVSEWTWDWYSRYETDPVTDPVGPHSGSSRSPVFRGGSWVNSADEVRVAARMSLPDRFRYNFIGFRLIRTSP